ncbi:MAG: DUF4160 domain-containing protein [Phycisphaerales bacterium]
MPEVFRVGALIFFLWSNEGREPPHVHVRKGSRTSDAIGKWWLNPIAHVSANGFTPAELRTINRTIVERLEEIMNAWRKHFES